MLPNILIHPILVLTSLTTASGVMIHDTKIDKMTVTAITSPAASSSYEAGNVKIISLSTDAHTHTERNSLSQVVNDLKTPNPRQQPRGTEDKKHLMQKHVAKGHQLFDGYSLPL
jgi:hypothetical protein